MEAAGWKPDGTILGIIFGTILLSSYSIYLFTRLFNKYEKKKQITFSVLGTLIIVFVFYFFGFVSGNLPVKIECFIDSSLEYLFGFRYGVCSSIYKF